MCEAKFRSWIEDGETHIAVETPNQEGKHDEKAIVEWIRETASKEFIEALENHFIYGSGEYSDGMGDCRNADRT